MPPHSFDSSSPGAELHITPPTQVIGCTQALQWECGLPPSLTPEALVRGLKTQGYKDHSQFDWVWDFRNPQEHKIIFVPATKRLQIRIHYTTPHEKRQTEAWKVALDLNQVCTENSH